MSATALRIEDYVGEPPDLSGQLISVSGYLAEVERELAGLRRRMESLCAQANELQEAKAVEVVAQDMVDLERRHAAMLGPFLKRAEQNHAEIRRTANSHTAIGKSSIRLSGRAVDVIAGWLEAIRDTRIRLHLIASEKMRAGDAPDTEIANEDDLDRFFQRIDEG